MAELAEKGLTRRGFLTAIGLGGVALTLPKPLGIVAARMADLERPPIHAGVCEIPPLIPGPRGTLFMARGITLSLPRDIPLHRYRDYCDSWIFHLVMKKVADGEVHREVLVRTLAAYVPDGSARVLRPNDSSIPDCMTMYEWPMRDAAECWLTPDPYHPPKYPLPKVIITLTGHCWDNDPDPQPFRWYIGKSLMWRLAEFQRVRIERVRAIKLGLCGPDEPQDLLEA